MRSPLALLLVAPLLACFADPGSMTVTAASSETTTTDVTTGEPTTAGSLAETDTSVGPTSSDDTSTTVTPTTGPAGNCELAPECKPGEIETGALCDRCDVQRRTCTDDCTWTPMACEQDLATCEYWLLPAGTQQWERVAVDPLATFAPKETVLAAISLAPQQTIYALTATSYHMFSTEKRVWTAAGARDSILPQISGQALAHATGLTVDAPDTIVTLVAGTEAFSYTYVGATNTFDYVGKTPCCGEDWTGPNAPDPFAVRDSWSKIGDPEGWTPTDVQGLCGLDEPVPVFGYQVSIGDELVYPQDVGYCFDFYPPVPYAQFTPFSYPGAPPNELIGGVEYVDGLWVFRGE